MDIGYNSECTGEKGLRHRNSIWKCSVPNSISSFLLLSLNERPGYHHHGIEFKWTYKEHVVINPLTIWEFFAVKANTRNQTVFRMGFWTRNKLATRVTLQPTTGICNKYVPFAFILLRTINTTSEDRIRRSKRFRWFHCIITIITPTLSDMTGVHIHKKQTNDVGNFNPKKSDVWSSFHVMKSRKYVDLDYLSQKTNEKMRPVYLPENEQIDWIPPNAIGR